MRDFIQGYLRGCRAENSWYVTMAIEDQIDFDRQCVLRARAEFHTYADDLSEEGQMARKKAPTDVEAITMARTISHVYQRYLDDIGKEPARAAEVVTDTAEKVRIIIQGGTIEVHPSRGNGPIGAGFDNE